MTDVIMPKQGLQMVEGTITQWLKQPGDKVQQGEPLFEIETEKVILTIDAKVSGTLVEIVQPEGATVPITEVVAVIDESN